MQIGKIIKWKYKNKIKQKSQRKDYTTGLPEGFYSARPATLRLTQRGTNLSFNIVHLIKGGIEKIKGVTGRI